MDAIVRIIDSTIKARGLTQKYVSGQAHMHPDLLSKSLQGTRKLKADEFVMLCRVLNLTLDDFDENPQAS